MIVTLTVQEVVEACKEWLKTHYNIDVPKEQGAFIKNRGVGAATGDLMGDIQVSFNEIEKPAPQQPYR